MLKLATDVANGMAHLSAQKVFGHSLYYLICVIARIGRSPGKNVKFKIQMKTANLIYSSRGVRILTVIYRFFTAPMHLIFLNIFFIAF